MCAGATTTPVGSATPVEKAYDDWINGRSETSPPKIIPAPVSFVDTIREIARGS